MLVVTGVSLSEGSNILLDLGVWAKVRQDLSLELQYPETLLFQKEGKAHTVLVPKYLLWAVDRPTLGEKVEPKVT